MEEDLDGIRPAQQMVLLAVALDGDTDILKHLGIKQVVSHLHIEDHTGNRSVKFGKNILEVLDIEAYLRGSRVLHKTTEQRDVKFANGGAPNGVCIGRQHHRRTVENQCVFFV